MITVTTALVVLVLRVLFPWGPRTGQHAGCDANAVNVWELYARVRPEHDRRHGVSARMHHPCRSTA